MKIVILDGYTENPGDLSWHELARLGEVRPASRPEFRHLKENNPTRERGGGVKFWRA